MAKGDIDYGWEVRNLVEHFGLLTCRKDKNIYRYMEERGIYIPLDPVEINRLIDLYIREAGTDLPWMDYSFTVLSKHISTVSDYVDEMGAPAGTIVFLNGTYKVGKGKLFKHSSKNLALSVLPCEYNPKATAKKFEAFIKSVADGDKKMELTLVEMLGVVLTHSARKAQKMGLFFGNGSNGKSLYLRLCECLAKDVTANISLSDIASDKAFDRIAILNANLLCIHELEQGLSMNKLLGENVKRIVTSETISAEPKFKEKVYFRPNSQILVASNYHPIIESPSPSLKRRLLMLEFRRSFLGEERNPNLYKEIVTNELSGVVNIALEGYERLKAQNFVFSSQADSDRFYEDMVVETNPTYAFVKECVAVEKEGVVKNETLLRAYKSWAGRNAIHVYGDDNSISKQLVTALHNADIPFTPDKSNGLRVKKGIVLK